MSESMKNHKNILVIYGKSFPTTLPSPGKFDVIVADPIFRDRVVVHGGSFVDLETLIDPGSVQEASILLEELPQLSLPNGPRITKSFLYKGYELWWIHYNSLFYFFCIPYTQHKRVLEYLVQFQTIILYEPPHKNLFACYFQAHGCAFSIHHESVIRMSQLVPLGIFFQIVITFLSVPMLMLRRSAILVFIGDKLELSKDYDFRMKFVYEELRQKGLPFTEFVRSLESWKSLLRNALKRHRPVIYSEAIAFLGTVLSRISGGHRRSARMFGVKKIISTPESLNSLARFKLLIATDYLRTIYADVWAIRIMKIILRLIGIRAAFFTAALERNFHTVIGCKLCKIPTVGILHGVPSRQSTPYDYMTGFDGDKNLSLDSYGVWSEWWKEQYIAQSFTYKSEQLYVSGPMRPVVLHVNKNITPAVRVGKPRVLFIAEQTASPKEVLPYLRELLVQTDLQLTIKFRPFRDGFEDWLLKYEPNILKSNSIQIVKGGMQEAIENADVVVGCHSTGVLESLLQFKVPIFLRTQKWGDYYGMTESLERRHFFAENPSELVVRIAEASIIPRKLIEDLCVQYFGNPQKNGSAWAVERLQELLKK